MKKKVMILIIASILTVGGISVAYAAGKSNTNFNIPMMNTQNGGIQSNESFNNMIKIMKDNGFNDEAKAMANRDFGAINKLMTSINDADYKKMIDIMQKNGYGSMAKMMQSVSREDMINIHKGMMGR